MTPLRLALRHRWAVPGLILSAALIGSSVDEAALRQAGAAARAAASPITDKRGTAEYRRKVVAVLVRRAGAIARSRVEAQA